MNESEDLDSPLVSYEFSDVQLNELESRQSKKKKKKPCGSLFNTHTYTYKHYIRK